MARGKSSAFQGFAVAVTLTVLLALAVWAFALGGFASVQSTLLPSPAPLTGQVTSSYVFYNYTSAEHGFSLRYPVGFAIEEPVGELASFRAYASGVGHHPEIIEVIIDNSTSASSVFEEFTQDAKLSTDEVYTSTYTSPAGMQVNLVQARVPPLFPASELAIEEDSYILEAFFDCTKISEAGEKTSFTAFVLAVIPAGLEGDLAVARGVIDSFRC